MPTYPAPGVYVEELEFAYGPLRDAVDGRGRRIVGSLRPEHRWLPVRTVAAFLGRAEQGPVGTPRLIGNLRQFSYEFGGHVEGAYLAYAVQGFFQNGGSECLVVRLADDDLAAGLQELEEFEDVSLYCAPDIGQVPDPQHAHALARQLVAAAEMHGAMAILDPPAGRSVREMDEWRMTLGLDTSVAAAYLPWIMVDDGIFGREIPVPPCGHVAGAYARIDATRGFHHSPANEPLHQARDVHLRLRQGDIDVLNPVGLNALLYSPSRGVVIWGSRTLSSDPSWRYVRRRRLLQFVNRTVRAVTRWAVLRRADDAALRGEVAQQIADLLHLLWRSGALVGETEHDAYAVSIDHEPPTTPDFTVSCLLGVERDLTLPLRIRVICDG